MEINMYLANSIGKSRLSLILISSPMKAIRFLPCIKQQTREAKELARGHPGPTLDLLKSKPTFSPLCLMNCPHLNSPRQKLANIRNPVSV